MCVPADWRSTGIHYLLLALTIATIACNKDKTSSATGSPQPSVNTASSNSVAPTQSEAEAFKFVGGVKVQSLTALEAGYLSIVTNSVFPQRVLGSDDNLTLKAVATTRLREGDVYDITYSQDGKTIALVDYNQMSIQTLEGVGLRTRAEAKLEHRPTSILALPSPGNYVISDVYGGIHWVAEDYSTFKNVASLEPGVGKRLALALSPNGKLIATGSWDGELAILDAVDRRVLTHISSGQRFRDLAFSADGTLLAVGTTNATFLIWDLRTGEGHSYFIPKVDPRSEVFAIAISPDNQILVAGLNDSSITVWQLHQQTELHNYYVRDSSIMATAFHPSGNYFATAHAGDNSVRIWHRQSAKTLANLQEHNATVRTIAFNPKGNQLVSADAQGTVILWE